MSRVHGISYIDERLMMHDEATDRPYYYVIDRMYNVRGIVNRAGGLVERYAYDPYGRVLTCPLCREAVSRVRESAGQADMDTKGDILTSAGSDAGCHRQALLAGVDP